MAKVPFSKLGLKKKDDVVAININDIDIEVKQYLPVEDKLTLIQNVMNDAADSNNFINPTKVEVFAHLQIVFNYTNLNFTEKQKENLPKLYDLLESNGVIAEVCKAIPTTEYSGLVETINDTITAYHTYKNSAVGIMETISADYSNLDFNATAIQQKIANKDNVQFLSDVMNKLG